MKQHLNPFLYGKPVPPSRFIGREEALRICFARLHNGESTAVVGAPHIGKSSFLRYVRDDSIWISWLGNASHQYVFIDIDCHLLPTSYQPVDFWTGVVEQVESSCPDSSIQKLIGVVKQSAYEAFSLRRLFDLLGRRGMRAAVLIDEFEVLLHHNNFNTAEFFGALRSLAIQTDGLSLLTASRMSVGEMNRRSQEINPFGSPFFNNLIEVRLQPLRPIEVDLLVDQMLNGTGVVFSPEDRAYIVRATGRHPFLVQIAAAALFEAVEHNNTGADKYSWSDQGIQSLAAAHFEDVWNNMETSLKQVAFILALTETQQDNISFKFPDGLAKYDFEMRMLSDSGFVESTINPNCAVWRGEGWRIGASSFTRWLANTRKWEEVLDSGNFSTRSASADAERVNFLQEKLTTMRRRFQVLELQRVRAGNTTEPKVIIEIEDLQRAIADGERELRSLGGAERTG